MKKILLFLCAIFFITDAGSTGIGANDTTAPCDNNTLGQTSGTANIEVDWQPNTINISWYSNNTQLNGPTTCNYDGVLVLPSTQPTRTGYTFKGWTVSVPSGYTRLEYLESTGEQYIDTGKIVKSDTRAKFEYQFTDTYGNYVFGQVQGNAYCVIGFRTTRAWWFNPNDQSILNDTLKHSVEYSLDGKIYRDGNIIGSRGNFGFEQEYTILLFAERNDPQNGSINKGKVKIYYFELLEGTTLVRNFIPARRNSDSVLGMYDTVTGTFFTNAGTGTFIAGPTVN